MKWASATSQRETLLEALSECLEQLSDFGAPVDLALAFSVGFRQELEGLPKRLRVDLQPRSLVGCSGGGVIGGGREIESGKALSLTIAHLPEVEIHAFHLDSESLPDADAPPDVWREVLGVPGGGPAPHFLLFSEPFSFELDALLRGLDYAYPRSVKLGGVAANAQRAGGNRLVLDHQVYSRGMGVALIGLQVEALVAQGCRPIGEPHTVTSGERNLLFELDHKPALGCLQETLRALPKRDRKRAEKSLLLGFQGQSGLSLASLLDVRRQPKPEYLIRNLVGADIKRGALAAANRVRSGQTVQFHLRDAEAARDDLASVLRGYRPSSAPSGALLFSCVGRGEGFFGQPNFDTTQLRKAFPNLAVGGFFGGGEIGPVADTTYVHGYSASFGLFRPL